MRTLVTLAVVPAMIGCSSGAAHGHARHGGDVEARDAEMAALRLELDTTEQELRVQVRKQELLREH